MTLAEIFPFGVIIALISAAIWRNPKCCQRAPNGDADARSRDKLPQHGLVIEIRNNAFSVGAEHGVCPL